jgi:hypothetical protein
MNEKPWLFKGPMVLAILGGLKTQTRRLDGLAAVNRKPSAWQYGGFGGYVSELNGQYEERFDNTETGDTLWVKCPYWPRQVRWVRESGKITAQGFTGENGERWSYGDGSWRYKEDGITRNTKLVAIGWKSVPSIHMPRWASRITLEVLSVRVERVREISDEDAEREGIVVTSNGLGNGEKGTCGDIIGASPCDCFRKLWDSINGPRGLGWDLNPWVYAVQFRKCGDGET